MSHVHTEAPSSCSATPLWHAHKRSSFRSVAHLKLESPKFVFATSFNKPTCGVVIRLAKHPGFINLREHFQPGFDSGNAPVVPKSLVAGTAARARCQHLFSADIKLDVGRKKDARVVDPGGVQPLK